MGSASNAATQPSPVAPVPGDHTSAVSCDGARADVESGPTAVIEGKQGFRRAIERPRHGANTPTSETRPGRAVPPGNEPNADSPSRSKASRGVKSGPGAIVKDHQSARCAGQARPQRRPGKLRS